MLSAPKQGTTLLPTTTTQTHRLTCCAAALMAKGLKSGPRPVSGSRADEPGTPRPVRLRARYLVS